MELLGVTTEASVAVEDARALREELFVEVVVAILRGFFYCIVEHSDFVAIQDLYGTFLKFWQLAVIKVKFLIFEF